MRVKFLVLLALLCLSVDFGSATGSMSVSQSGYESKTATHDTFQKNGANVDVKTLSAAAGEETRTNFKDQQGSKTISKSTVQSQDAQFNAQQVKVDGPGKSVDYRHMDAAKQAAEASKTVIADNKKEAVVGKDGKVKVVDVEETKTITSKKNVAESVSISSKKTVNTQVKKIEKAKRPCVERLAEEKKECETKDIPKGYEPVFSYKDNDECDYVCSYKALPTVAPPPGKKVKKTVVKKKKVDGSKKDGGAKKGGSGKEAGEPKKECSGEKKIIFSNCLLKIKGLIAWGDKTKNFDKKFNRLVNQKKKKTKGGKGGPKKGGPKKTPPGQAKKAAGAA